MEYPRVLLVGGEEAELAHTLRGRFFEVDVVSAEGVARALEDHRYDAVVIGTVSAAERVEIARLVGAAGLQAPLDGEDAEHVLAGVSARVRASMVPRKGAAAPPRAIRGAKPTILLVDDANPTPVPSILLPKYGCLLGACSQFLSQLLVP